MKHCSFRTVARFASIRSLFAILLIATITVGCTKSAPTCIDDSVIALVKQAVDKKLAKEVAGDNKNTDLLERLKQRIQIAVTTIRTSNKDDKIGKVSCDASLEISIKNPEQLVGSPAFKSLQKNQRIPAEVTTSGPAWKSEIHYTAQHTEDSKDLLVELTGHTPMVQLLAGLTRSGAIDPKAAPAEFPSDLLAAANVHEAAVRLLNHVYGKQEPKHGCWMTSFENNPYCMQISQTDIKTVATGKRLYVIANGQAVDETGEAVISHAMRGLVGAFIVSETDGKAALVAKATTLQAGTDGAAPDWSLMLLGANDNWGWQGEFRDCHQGYCGTRMIILANLAGTVYEVGNVPTDYDDTGACSEDDCSQKEATLTSTVRVGTLPKDAAFFNLLVNVTGTDKGKVLEPKMWKLTFNSAKHRYVTPADWPFAGRDF